MHVNCLHAVIEADVHFTRDEINRLVDCSEKHYDGLCKAASKYGGLLYGFRNMLDCHPFLDVNCSWRDLDLLCKIAEMENDCQMLGGVPVRGDLGTKIDGMMKQMMDFSITVNQL